MTENTYRLPVFETVKLAWGKVKGAKATFWAVLGFTITLRLVEYGFIKVAHPLAGNPIAWVFLIMSIIVGFIAMTLSWSLLYIGVKRAFDVPIHYGMMRYTFSFYFLFKIIGLIILSSIIFLILMIPIILPHFIIAHNYLATTNDIAKLFIALITLIYLFINIFITALLIHFFIRMSLANLILVVENVGPWTAIKRSFELTKSNVWRLLGLYFVNFGVILLSLLTLGIGFIWTMPYFFINAGIVYKKLQAR